MSSPTLCHTLSLLPSPLSGPSLGRFSVTISLVASGLGRWLGPGFCEDPPFLHSHGQLSLSGDMRWAEGSVTLRMPLLLLGLWVVLAPAQHSQGRPSWRYISSEVVIPRKELHHGKGVQAPGWLSYSLRFGGQRHVIHMRRKKLFLPRHLVLMTQDDQGTLQVDYPFVPLDCYYFGYLEEVPFSTVTMDTCYGGLTGMMKLDDLAYEIQPLKDSPGFEHVVSQIVADSSATGPMYTLGYKEERHPVFSQVNASAASRASSKTYASHQGFLKGCLISANSVYRQYNNVSTCAKFLINLGSLMNSMLQNVDLRYYISSLVIYNQGDPTSMSYYNIPGNAFHSHYISNIFLPLQPQTSLVVIQDGPHDNSFTPVLYGVCKDTNLLMLGVFSRHYFMLSIIATQLTARSFGLFYDEPECVCQRRTTCIMDRIPLITDAFSNCSLLHATHVVNYHRVHCSYSTDFQYFNSSLTLAMCGNSVVDDGEECDCGSFKQCYTNACCQSDCTFRPGSACNTGMCCTNCSFSPPGTLCRPIQNICDLPEYCLGLTSTCPEDVYLQDGTPCSEVSYCYHGNCTDRSVHCKEIFGEGAINAPDACYTINKRENRFGHCTIRLSHTLQACADADIQCGRLQCTNVTHLPRLQDHVGFHQSVIQGSLCFGVDLHIGTYTTDVGHVRPGTPCGGGYYCNNSVCNASVADMNYDCEPNKCNYRGVCNSKRNCHCHIGWEPPRCINKGAGGSLDSGPPPRRMRSVRQSDKSVVYFRVVFGRMYAFIAALLFGVATNVKIIKTTSTQETAI
ncbi:disintegrin and metalloproteinase domain-containing protein 20-like [Phyllostomus discolor]|uniref:Disintegrin and metalloproteinase domain-containing protein 20-like n=1 Tax=Phyllostomus discolor TaxID=89673 RepID=A0A6J2L0I1_9CHIR|nr:disintegrin and metalloproteinase domain-containing protein 20-like [Phyllostomus discolor]